MTVSFGIFTGVIEGLGLLIFQRINWQRWGPMMHVSKEILWISPIVDVILFTMLGLLVLLASRVSPRVKAFPALIFILTFLTIYDWLTLTNRLLHLACLLLSLGAAVASTRWINKNATRAAQLLRRSSPALLAAWFLIFVAIQGGTWLRERRDVANLPTAAANAPNVLVIVVDTLRADHISSYGYSRQTTPEIDRLASEGALFENAIAPCSWSLPSHVSLVTGRYIYEHGVGNVQPMPWQGWGDSAFSGLPTLGEALEQRGYRTGAFSANRTYFSSSLGFKRGFQHFEDYFHSPADDFVRTLYGREFARIYLKRSNKSLMKRLLRKLDFTSLLDQDAEGSGSFGGAFGVRKRADVVNDEVLHWIDRDRQRPFFAFLNYFDVHDPYGGAPFYQKPAWAQQGETDRYDDGVKYDDDYIGFLLRALEQRGLVGNTVVVITGDHGESLGQHGVDTHGAALYWELIHVPLVIWYPGHVPAGLRIDRPVSNAAIAATVMDVIGDKRHSFPGPSLAAFWKTPGTINNWPNPIAELAQDKYLTKLDKSADPSVPTAVTGSMRSLIAPEWQLITHEKFGSQLYEWHRDPGETHNVVATPDGQKTAAELTIEIDKQRR
ncbi:MAG TPA: sulfatase [Terriglobales bacterium]|nr:sulfatase [Terriglobales bacterium]